MTLGKRIEQRREALGLSVADVARRAGMGASTLYDLERGDQKGSTRLHAIAEVLKTTAMWLETGRGDPGEIPSGTEAEEIMTLHGISVSESAVQVGYAWEQLPEPLRVQVRALIDTMNAAQEGGTAKKPAEPPAKHKEVRHGRRPHP